MNTKPIPAIITLIASAITCLIAILTHIETFIFLKILLLVIVVFYILGSVVKLILDRNINFKVPEEELEDKPNTPSENIEDLQDDVQFSEKNKKDK